MRGNFGIAGLAFFLFLTGCVSSRTDWNTRIGSYPYDRAVVDLGPPDKSTNLADGTVIASWYTMRYFGLGAGAASEGFGGPVGEELRVRTLTFGPDGILQSVRNP